MRGLHSARLHGAVADEPGVLVFVEEVVAYVVEGGIADDSAEGDGAVRG